MKTAIIVLGHNLSEPNAEEINYSRLMGGLYVYFQEEPNATLILSGGNPSGGGIESIWMKNRLPGGINYIVETESTDTIENFSFCLELVEGYDIVVLVTSDFHMERACKIFKKYFLAYLYIIKSFISSSFLNSQ